MNDLGWTLGWLAVQVAIVLIPAIGLHAMASRRGPASGAWVATTSLGMVVALGALAFTPGIGREAEEPGPGPLRALAHRPIEARADVVADDSRPTVEGGRPLEDFRIAWQRLGRRAARPVMRFRPWGTAIAVVMLAGSGVGLIRLGVGLWAVGLCRRRGRLVNDPSMLGVVDELRGLMGCRPGVELREVPDLATPATAGWRRPMLLLPSDWRSWNESERRAVVAHELAHVVRGDYAAGLLARVAVVLNYAHPMVRWMADRLHLEQELAADAMGATFAGGRSSYLLALSRLALTQDGRPQSWPARAFLPTRGTLIRRIKMLRDENQPKKSAKTWSMSTRLATALGLLSMTIGVAMWKAPAMAGDEPSPPPTPKAGAADTVGALPPFPVEYVPEGRLGIYAFHPSAILHRPGMSALSPMIRELAADDFVMFAKELQVDRSRPGFLKLNPEDIESVVGTFEIRSGEVKNAEDPELNGQKLYRLDLGDGGGLTVRTVAPFDWLAFLRQWNLPLDEVREPRGVYHKINWPVIHELGSHLGIYLPDDRTLVYDNVAVIKALIAREVPSAPAYLRRAEWDRVSRDLFALAVDNHDDQIARRINLGRPEDGPLLAFFKGVERLAFGLASSDTLSPRAELTGRDPKVAESVVQTIQSLLDLYRAAVAAHPGKAEDEAPFAPMAKRFLAALRVGHEGRTATASAEGFGTFADLAGVIKAMVNDGSLEIGPKAPNTRAAQAGEPIEKR